MLRDLRIAVRTLRSWRFGAVAAVLTLAVGIGTTIGLYTFLRAVMASTSTQIEEVERLARIYASNPAAGAERVQIAPAEFQDVLSHARSFASLGAWASIEVTAKNATTAETLSASAVSPGYFAVLRARPALGRLFSPDDFASGEPVALVSTRTWRRLFAGRTLADGPTLERNGLYYRVVGVVPPDVEFMFIGIGGDAWIPLAGRDAEVPAVSVIARLKQEVSWPTAFGELSALTSAAQREAGWRFQAIPVQYDSRYRAVAGAAGTLVPAFVILVICCVNVACMLLARGIDRETELSVRAALGASRGSIFRQLLLENLLLAAIGGVVGGALGAVLVRLIASSTFAAAKPGLAERLASDMGLLPIALGATAVACVLFGTWPALRLSRRDVSGWLKGVALPTRVRVPGYGARDVVVFFELGLAAMLVVVTAMWFSLFGALQNVTISFAADELIALDIPRLHVLLAAERVAAVPGVESITIVTAPPGSRRLSRTLVRTTAGGAGTVNQIGIDDAFFRTTGLRIVRGRGFDRSEAASNAPVAVVSEAAARALWRDSDPLGQELDVNGLTGPARVTIVGVSRDARKFSAVGLEPGDLYRPLDSSRPLDRGILVRAPNARAILRTVANAARSSDAAAPATATIVADALFHGHAESVGAIRLFGGFGLLALLLAGSGIFGVISQSLAQRRTEFGVRIALGASRTRVLWMVISREGKLIAAALAAATIGTVAVTRTLFAELVSISAMNPGWPAGLIALCGAVAAVALGLAMYRILKLEPADVLRKI